MLSEVKFRCGHTGMLDLTGQAEERAHKAAWYAAHVICPDCRQHAARERAAAVRSRPASPKDQEFGFEQGTTCRREL